MYRLWSEYYSKFLRSFLHPKSGHWLVLLIFFFSFFFKGGERSYLRRCLFNQSSLSKILDLSPEYGIFFLHNVTKILTWCEKLQSVHSKTEIPLLESYCRNYVRGGSVEGFNVHFYCQSKFG